MTAVDQPGQREELATPDYTLGPATRLLWRSPAAVHLELGPRAVVVENLGADVVGRLVARRVAGDPPPVDPTTRTVLDHLTAQGFLWHRLPEPAPGLAAPPPDDPRLLPPVPRLAGELHSLATRHGPAGAEMLAARHHARVLVHGGGRVAAHLATLLAAAGVGRVVCTDAGAVRLGHLLPGGLEPRDEGRDLAAAVHDAVQRAAPETDTAPLPPGQLPDLVVLTGDAPIADEHRAALHADGLPHLAVTLGVDGGVVGPLVVPGLTSCLRCADLHRAERDPAWMSLAGQLTVPRRYGPASDTAVAALVSSVATLQTLAFVDGTEPACIDGTLEFQLPDWRVRRRSRPVHADYDCSTGADPAVRAQ